VADSPGKETAGYPGVTIRHLTSSKAERLALAREI